MQGILSSNLKNKAHLAVFWFFLFFLPSQLAYHFWPSWAKVYGLRVDYLAPKIYLTDIFLILTFLFWLFTESKELVRKARQLIQIQRRGFLVLFTFLFVLVNVFNARNLFISFNALFNLIKLLTLSLYVYANKKAVLKLIPSAFGLALVYVFLIALVQLSLQKSTGLFYLLGERRFYIDTPGIATFSLFGQKFLRPYSTFSHPNQMAGFVLVVSGLLLLGKNTISRLQSFFSFLSLVLVTVSVSKSAILAALIGGALTFVLVKKRLGVKFINFFFIVLIGLTFLTVLVAAFTNHSHLPDFIARRLDLSLVAESMFVVRPLHGVGLGNFTAQYSQFFLGNWWLQPVHNIYLLLLAETGVIGLVIFVFMMRNLLKTQIITKNYKIFFCLLIILIEGLFDHFFLTLQQTSLLAFLVFGLAVSAPKKRV